MQENSNVGANKGWKKFKEVFMEIIFLIAACVSIAAVALICIFLFANGIPAIKEIEILNLYLKCFLLASNE